MIKNLSIYETNKIPFKAKSVSGAWDAAGTQKCCLVCMRPWIWCPVQDSERQCGEERGQQGQKSKREHSLHSSCKHYLKRTPRLLGGGGAVKSPLSSSFVPSRGLGSGQPIGFLVSTKESSCWGHWRRVSECKVYICSIAPGQWLSRLWPTPHKYPLVSPKMAPGTKCLPSLGPSNSFLGLKLSLIPLTPGVPPTVPVSSELLVRPLPTLP